MADSPVVPVTPDYTTIPWETYTVKTAFSIPDLLTYAHHGGP
jgi:hypothetical protein